MTLTDEDRRSALWTKLRAHLVAELDKLRLKNDSSALDAQQTAHLRGRIAAVKDVLRLEQPDPLPKTD